MYYIRYKITYNNEMCVIKNNFDYNVVFTH